MKVNFKTDKQREKLQGDIWKLRRILTAEIELLQGQKFFNDAVFDSENLEIDIIYDAIDCCGNAQKIAFESQDTEIETRCEAFMGKIFFKGLKNLKKAKTHLSNAIRLENTLRPRNCVSEPWFQLCT